MRHLEAKAFAGAPKWLGLDSDGREILSYLAGDVPAELGSFSADQVASAARLLCDLHDATVDFDARAGHEAVCHGDPSPCWLDLGNEDLDPVQQGRRIGEFVAAYGRIDIADSIPAVLDAQTELSRRPGAPVRTQEWAAHCFRWSTENRSGLTTGLALARRATF